MPRSLPISLGPATSVTGGVSGSASLFSYKLFQQSLQNEAPKQCYISLPPLPSLKRIYPIHSGLGLRSFAHTLTL